MPSEPSENPYQPPVAHPAADSDPGAEAPLKDPRTRGWAAVSFIELNCLMTLGRFVQPDTEKWRSFFMFAQGLTWFGAMIAYLMWIHRSASNARRIDPQSGPKPVWAVACHFIPFINWLMPALVLKEIADSTFKHRATKGLGLLVGVWWVSFVTMFLLGTFKPGHITLVALASTWIAGLTIAVLIVRISMRQSDFRWSDLPASNRPVMLPSGTPRPALPGKGPHAASAGVPASRPQPPRRPAPGGKSEGEDG